MIDKVAIPVNLQSLVISSAHRGFTLLIPTFDPKVAPRFTNKLLSIYVPLPI
jgi:hypothetical protein